MRLYLPAAAPGAMSNAIASLPQRNRRLRSSPASPPRPKGLPAHRPGRAALLRLQGGAESR